MTRTSIHDHDVTAALSDLDVDALDALHEEGDAFTGLLLAEPDDALLRPAIALLAGLPEHVHEARNGGPPVDHWLTRFHEALSGLTPADMEDLAELLVMARTRSPLLLGVFGGLREVVIDRLRESRRTARVAEGLVKGVDLHGRNLPC